MLRGKGTASLDAATAVAKFEPGREGRAWRGFVQMGVLSRKREK